MSKTGRGVLRPENIGHAFTLDRRAPPADLADVLDCHWTVRWDLRGLPDYRSEVLTHPAVHLVLEPHGAFVYGVRRRLDVRTLTGSGYAMGTKFLPGGFASFTGRPIVELTDSVLGAEELFGDRGHDLARMARDAPDPGDALGLVHELLRASRRPAAPESELVASVVTQMQQAPPGTLVSELAERHAVSARTLQRLFARYVGVSPKWVLQRYRLHEALEQMAGQVPDWTRLALDLGYFDHPHFIRDFRAVTGRTPRDYERTRRA